MSFPITRSLARRLAQLAAVWLLVLIASPFTAPFATCELNAAAFDIALDDERGVDSVTAKILSDTALPVFNATPALLAMCLAELGLDPARALSSQILSSPLPLRL